MTNFDPEKLKSFINAHKGLTSEETSRLLGKKDEPLAGQPTSPVTEQGPSGFDAYFTPGHIIIVSRPGEKPEEYRVINTINGKVKIRSTDNRQKGEEEISEEELKKIAAERNEDKPRYPPLSDLFSAFSEKTEHNLKGLLSWKKKWIDSGEIDRYRASYQTDIRVSAEQVADAKKGIEFYIEVLKENELLPNAIMKIITSDIALSARLLTGVHDDKGNDIEYFVKNNLLANGTDMDRVRDEIEKIKHPPTPAVGVTKPPTIADVRDTWPSYILFEPKRGWTYLNKALPIREWTRASENIRPVFDEYREFMLRGNSKDQERKVELYRSLIDAKSKVVDALHKALDSTAQLEIATQEAAELKRLVEEKKEEWKIEQENVAKNKKFEADTQAFRDKFEKLQEELAQEKEKVKALGVWQLSSDRTAFIDRLVDDANKAQAAVKRKLAANQADVDFLNYYEGRVKELLKQVKATDDRYAGLSADKRTGLVLRPSNLKKVRGNDTRTVTIRGGEKISVNEWLEKEEKRKSDETRNADLEKKRTETELLDIHREMYEEDPETYKQLYQYKNYVPGDITREVADMILQGEGGVRPPEENPRKKETPRRNSLVNYRMTYSPARDASLDWMPVKEVKENEEEKKTPARNDSRPEAEQLEDQVTRRSAGFDTLKDILETPHGSGMVRPEKDSWVAQAEERPRPVEREERESMLRKVNATLDARIKGLLKTKWIKSHPIWFLIGVAAITSAIVSENGASRGGPVPTTPIATAPAMDYANWRSYLYWMVPNKKEVPIIEDIVALSPEEVVKKHAPLSGTKLLPLDAYKVRWSSGNCPELNDSQRKEACVLIALAEKTAGALIAAEKVRMKGMPEQEKQQLLEEQRKKPLEALTTQGTIFRDYLDNIRAARARLERLDRA